MRGERATAHCLKTDNRHGIRGSLPGVQISEGSKSSGETQNDAVLCLLLEGTSHYT